MAFALVLFDFDGMTAIVPTKYCGDVSVASQCEIRYQDKKHLVEVLELSGIFFFNSTLHC